MTISLALLAKISSTAPESYHTLGGYHSIADENFGETSTEKAFTIQWLKYLSENKKELERFYKDSTVKKEITQHLSKYSFLGGAGNPTFVDLVLYSCIGDKVKSTYQVERLDKFGSHVLRWFNFLHASLGEDSVVAVLRC